MVMMLMPHVPTDDVLINADGRNEVSSRPKGMLFIQAVFYFDLLFQPCGGLSFQDLHDVGDGISRRCEKTEMDVIVLNIQLHHLPMLPFADGFEDSAQLTLHFVWSKDIPTVFGCPNKVVFEIVKTMR